MTEEVYAEYRVPAGEQKVGRLVLSPGMQELCRERGDRIELVPDGPPVRDGDEDVYRMVPK